MSFLVRIEGKTSFNEEVLEMQPYHKAQDRNYFSIH